MVEFFNTKEWKSGKQCHCENTLNSYHKKYQKEDKVKYNFIEP